ncbi:iron export ABC transporter permease subunit FetB [Spirulina sp. CS-785/01]|uniref:ABC transporter permease n=1 Tax=Spirulina sp. CS-785/01 TaxID=3021716 RepID=UPI002330D131|nr:iron export ABC transporter permease subunit FetB [Spirulina sp. CS-785/01]MDB9312104.1 iron export ABC transporter permease subunit FetB [Spirulina sp. CS-785/01]
MEAIIELDLLDLALSLGLVGVAMVLSLWQRLQLEQQLLLATGRTVLQLLVAGYLLAFVFEINQPWLVLLAIAAMTTVAAMVTRNRIAPKLPLLSLIWLSLAGSTFLTLSYTILLIVQPPQWYSPQYLIPLAGMVLGNAMNAATLAGERLVSTLRHSALEIETHLSLGASPQQAIQTYRQASIRAGLIPLINRMMVVGLVTLPGMLTGQVLSGVNPINASLYQILVMFMMAFAEMVIVLWVTWGVSQQFFNPHAQYVVKNSMTPTYFVR